MARMDMINKRLWILVIILLLMLVITNYCWISYNRQFEVVEETTTEEVVTQDVRAHGDSDAVVAGIGDATNGGSRETDGEAEDHDTAVQTQEEKVTDEG